MFMIQCYLMGRLAFPSRESKKLSFHLDNAFEDWDFIFFSCCKERRAIRETLTERRGKFSAWQLKDIVKI